MPDKWLDQSEQIMFSNAGGNMVDANELLKTGPVNKTIVDEFQATSLIVARIASDRLCRLHEDDPDGFNPYDWTKVYPDLTEQYQQTMNGETNSRVQFIKLGMAQIQNMATGLKRELENLVK